MATVVEVISPPSKFKVHAESRNMSVLREGDKLPNHDRNMLVDNRPIWEVLSVLFSAPSALRPTIHRLGTAKY